MKFNLPAYATNYFSTTVWIKCPKCGEKALVTSQPTNAVIPLTNNAEAHCTSCSFKTIERNWSGYYQGFINLSCGYCGTRITHCTKPIKEIYAKENVTCTSCHKKRAYGLLWAPYKSNTATDPFFGYDLWLQIEVKNNILWGYNKEHLTYIRTYIEATLREDNSRHKYSLIANLPQWMVLAKNRDSIVKKIDKLISLV
ncbi:MAG: hypothetical protein HWD85_00595 [Flavobacteriaceae bacterium]|nr:hypothetical protein [Flavobacteriaceae bacterium]